MKSVALPVLIGLIILLSAIFIFVIVVWIYRSVLKTFAKGGAWGKLAEKYPVETEPTEISLPKQTIRVGAVRYRRCVTAGLLADGMYIAITLPAHAPLFIPWDEFHLMGKTRIYARQALQWSIGKPEIARISFPMPLSEKLKPFL